MSHWNAIGPRGNGERVGNLRDLKAKAPKPKHSAFGGALEPVAGNRLTP